MAAVKHARNLAAITGATGALLLSMSPVRAHAASLGGGIYNLAPMASVAVDENLKWNPDNDSWKWDDDSKGHDEDNKDQGQKDVPEPGTCGLYLSALLGGAFYLRARKSRSR